MNGEEVEERTRKGPVSAGSRVRLGRAGKDLEVRIRYRAARRLPRSLGASAIMLFAVIAFFGGVAGDAWPQFLGMLAAAVALVALCIWALIKSPIRPTFDQRWKPKRRIEPLDLTAWIALADRLEGKVWTRERLPRMEAEVRGVAVRIEFVRIGGARTVATATLPRPVSTRLEVRPLRAEYHTPIDRDTGDPEFDDAFRAPCEDAGVAKEILTPEVRKWIIATEPELFAVEGRKVTAHRRSFVSELDMLQGLVELVAAASSRN